MVIPRAPLLLFVATATLAAARADTALSSVTPQSLPSPACLERHVRSLLAESNGDAEGAIAWAESASTLDPGSSFAMSRVAQLQEATGEDSAALDRAERALALDSLNSEAAMVAGRMRFLAGQPRLAVRVLTPPLRQASAMPELFALRALAHQMTRNYGAALADLERTGPLLPDFHWMAAGILAMALEDGRLDEAHAAFELAIKLRPDDPRTVTLGVSLARRTGNLAMERALRSRLQASALP